MWNIDINPDTRSESVESYSKEHVRSIEHYRDQVEWQSNSRNEHLLPYFKDDYRSIDTSVHPSWQYVPFEDPNRRSKFWYFCCWHFHKLYYYLLCLARKFEEFAEMCDDQDGICNKGFCAGYCCFRKARKYWNKYVHMVRAVYKLNWLMLLFVFLTLFGPYAGL